MKKIFAVLLMVFCSVYICNAETNIPSSSTVKNYGHRGCRGLEPENSMPAYVKALEIGVDLVDMDVNLTKDDILVVTHNASLNPDFTRNVENSNIIELITKQDIKDNKLYIKDMSLKDIQNKFDIGRKDENSRYAGLFPNQKIYKDKIIKIPTLKEVVDYVQEHDKNMKFQIEMKCWPFGFNHSTESLDMANALFKFLKEENIIDKTEVQSFDWIALTSLYEMGKKEGYEIKTAYLLIPPIGVLSQEEQDKIKADPELNKMLEQSEKNIANFTASGSSDDKATNSSLYKYLVECISGCGGYSIEPLSNLTTQAMVDIAHKNGLKLIVWDSPELTGTDFSEETAQRMIDYGVDGIITDRPDKLKKMLSEEL